MPRCNLVRFGPNSHQRLAARLRPAIVSSQGIREERRLDMTHHRCEMDWMGQRISSLKDLWPQDLRAAVVGINPAPSSVEAGHYYQGNLGQLLFRRLRKAGILEDGGSGYEDDQALKVGIGFTDVVKRPTASAAGVLPEELAFGKRLLTEKLVAREVPLVIFAFKKSAETILGKFHGNGFIASAALGDSQVFVMPGPYESLTTSNVTLSQLRDYWRQANSERVDR